MFRMCLCCDREEIDEAHALSASLADVQRQGHISVIDQRLAQHPMIKPASTSAASTEACAPAARYQGRAEDFPSLDGTSESSTDQPAPAPKPGVSENPGSSSRPQTEMSLAKKLAMSSRLSVRSGRMDLADFPNLPNSRPTKAGKGRALCEEDFPNLSGASCPKLSKPSAASAWHATDKGSVEQSRLDTGTERSSENSARGNRYDDFPSLVSTASASDLSACLTANLPCRNSLASISRNFSTGSLKKVADQAETDVALNPNSLSWGPELSRKSDNRTEAKERDKFLHLKTGKKSGGKHEASCADNGRQTPKELSDHAKASTTKSNISDKSESAISCTKVKSKSEISNKAALSSTQVPTAQSETADKLADDASTTDSLGWTQVGGVKKTESRTSKKNVAKLQTNKASREPVDSTKVTKSSAKSEDSSCQSKNGQDKSKKKQKANSSKAQRENPAENSDSKYATKQLVEPHAVTNLKSGKEKRSSDASNKEVLSETAVTLADSSASSNVDAALSCEKRDAGDGSGRITEADSEGTETVDNSVTLDVTSFTAAADSATAGPVFDADDFPSLTVPQPVPSSLLAAPPGFSAVSVSSSKPPPPGFSNPALSSRPPPGLNSSVSPAIVSDADGVDNPDRADSEMPVSTFIPPRDMQQRSASLGDFITTAVKDGSFGEFRELSEKFRSGNISAGEYHRGCYDIMDPTAFLSIFPELIALLPDLPKQNQLLKVHRDFLSKAHPTEKTRSWCMASEDGLVSCMVCSQVLRHSDLSDHASEHGTFNAEYPTLPNSSLCSVR